LCSTVAQAIPLLMAFPNSSVTRAYLPRLCSGELTATVALADDDGRWDVDAGGLVASREGERWFLDGVRGYVVDGASADLLLVVGQAAGQPGVWAISAPFTGVRRDPLATLDLTRRQARLVLGRAPAELVGGPGTAGPIGSALEVSRALLAAEEVGGAQACLDMTVRHVSTRLQWGRPIGSFQAVKQRAADMLVAVESARSAARAAAEAADRARAADSAEAATEELLVASAVAAWFAAEAYVQVAGDTIQLHGGIGFTWDHDAHLYYKRSRTDLQLLGEPTRDLERLAVLLEGVVQ
jgi:alkylation response protein AidB-like acyl-CoA dehydrogenase